jgi:hypothetical protein
MPWGGVVQTAKLREKFMKRDQEMTLKESKRSEILDQVIVRTYFINHVQTSPDGNTTQTPYQLLLGEEALSVAFRKKFIMNRRKSLL